MGTLFSLSKSATSVALDTSEIVLLLFGVLLTVGLIGEYAKAERWKIHVKTFEMLVIIGVAGELLADGGIFLFSSHLQTIADQDIADLTITAGNAKASAKDAHDLGIDLLGKYKTAEQEIVEFKAAKLPRRLSAGQKTTLRKRVAMFGTKTISLSCGASSANEGAEALDFELDLFDAFNVKSPLKVETYNVSCSMLTGFSVFIPPIRVVYSAQRKGDAFILIKALEEIGIHKKDITTKTDANSSFLDLAIGPKPE
jgi:hypothetical protein